MKFIRDKDWQALVDRVEKLEDRKAPEPVFREGPIYDRWPGVPGELKYDIEVPYGDLFRKILAHLGLTLKKTAATPAMITLEKDEPPGYTIKISDPPSK